MKISETRTRLFPSLAMLFSLTFSLLGCTQKEKTAPAEEAVPLEEAVVSPEVPEYFLLRPELEKAYGYSHAVRIGNDIKISGAVSMDEQGNLTAPGDMEQQMKNCYADLEKILAHYGYTFDDVIVENVFTTDMAKFIEVSGFRSTIYKKQFPTGTWLEVKGLALPGQLIEIEMEAHRPE